MHALKCEIIVIPKMRITMQLLSCKRLKFYSKLFTDKEHMGGGGKEQVIPRTHFFIPLLLDFLSRFMMHERL